MPQSTKQALADALKRTLPIKAIDKITVKELVGLCGINRQTFYYHFQDIYDLLGWIYKTEALAAIQDKKSCDTWQQGLLQILEYVESNRALCINTYRSLAKDHLERFLDEVLTRLLGDVVDEIAGSAQISDPQKHFIAKFYSCAFAGVLLDWIGTGLKTPAPELARQISLLMEGNIHRAVGQLGR